MIASFLDKNFKGLQNNASLVITDKSYKLIKRPIELNSISFECEAFTEDIQPTFLIVSDNLGRYEYACLAGIPTLNNNNQTEVVGTDLKTLLSSDVILEVSEFNTVNDYINYIFNTWNSQVNQGSFDCEIVYKESVGFISFSNLIPSIKKGKFDALEEIQKYLRAYDLYLDTKLDLVNKKVQFIIGNTMLNPLNIRLWEHNIYNYGKWIANVNECQGYYEDQEGNYIDGTKWILTSDNRITSDEINRDIYPIKRRVFINNKNLASADEDALCELLDSLYNENIEISALDIYPDFETKFAIYINRGEDKYKDLPCGELHYDASGLTKIQIGYRYTLVEYF